MPAAIPALVAVAGAVAQSKAASKARKAQEQAAREANATIENGQQSAQEFEQQQADQARADRAPWLEMGTNKLAELGRRTAPGGDLMRNFGMSDFQQDPGYQFRQAEAQKAITNSAAARGGLLSGAAAKALQGRSQDIASAEYGNAYSRFNNDRDGQYNKLASLAHVGQVSADKNGADAMQLGNSVGNALLQTGRYVGENQIGIGNARASGYLAQGNALVGAINQGASAWNQYNNGNRG